MSRLLRVRFILYCKKRGVIDDARIDLAGICAAALKRSLPKDESIRLSNWDAQVLSNEQINYAALDAWVGLQIYHKVKQYGLVGKRISRPVTEGMQTLLSIYQTISDRETWYRYARIISSWINVAGCCIW